MTKVWCATLECKHNKGNQCHAKTVNFADGHINTVHEGYKQVWYCGTYEMSEKAKTLKKMLKGYFDGIGGKDGNDR